jgi:hypothetical protein
MFGKVKSMLNRREIPDEVDLLHVATEILNGNSDAELQSVFRSWMKYVERVIDAGRDYLTK